MSSVSASAELQRLWKTVEVATTPSNPRASSADLARVVDALTAMAKVSGVTSEVIRRTGLGLKLRPLRKHADAGVKAAATRVVKRWREVVETEALGNDAAPEAERENGGGGGGDDARESGDVGAKLENGKTARMDASAKEEETVNKAKKDEVEDGEGNDGSDEVDVSHLDPMRKKIGEKLGQAVALAASNDEERRRATRIGFEIEAAMMAKLPPDLAAGDNPTHTTGKNYKQKARSLLFNLNDAKNPDLRARVLQGSIGPELLCDLKSEELASDSKRSENGEIRKRMLEDSIRGQQNQASTDQFKVCTDEMRACDRYVCVSRCQRGTVVRETLKWWWCVRVWLCVEGMMMVRREREDGGLFFPEHIQMLTLLTCHTHTHTYIHTRLLLPILDDAKFTIAHTHSAANANRERPPSTSCRREVQMNR